jgi:hypothetical protein
MPGTGIVDGSSAPPLAGNTAAALGDDEQQQLLAALRQPLFLQTPLQSLLEHVVQRLAASTVTVAELQRKVAHLERTNISQHDLTERMRSLETRLEAPITSVTPFAVAQLAGRIGALEATALRLEEDSKQLKYTTSDVRVKRMRDL